jgi:hypothetical protein
MAGCGRGRVIAHPTSAPFCSPQVKLTTPSGLLRDFELHWPARFLLNDCDAVTNLEPGTDILDLQPNEIAASELAIDCEVNNARSRAVLQLQPHKIAHTSLASALAFDQ